MIRNGVIIIVQEPLDTSKLVEETLSVIPLMAKKIFGPIHVLQDSDLHHTHFHILNIIADAGSIRTTEIGKKLAIRKSNLTPLLNKLITKKFILRIRDNQDRRVIYIEVTEEGKNFLAEKKGILQEEVKERLAKLDLEDQRKLQEAVFNLNSVLEKLTE
ncbi:MarR family winged helix-turn-helix transcriptional regulator [Halobacillus amylolyticus]|uniref:MarR family transcriptional regulator n=1 Tax=Halobacillus amylolyticus TaxID=2932259 RepID=A0ABY4H723_9BACI|nr:MarR family transcriptional regulator [Halobacillus amylolyticus]UOR10243.1 MarR family transcriptional regulator [Halobacillus amylolyticus]